MKESADEKSYPDVPEIAIVKPEEERPIKTIKRSEEELDGSENEADYEHMDQNFLTWMEMEIPTLTQQ